MAAIQACSRRIFASLSSISRSARGSMKPGSFRSEGSQILIEATSNQVNHHGGYTGMQPQDFRKLVLDIAKRTGLDEARIILGGDHLGPNPWQERPATEAMAEAERMVQAYVRAGFEKIHLDASMACADDPHPLPGETVAKRAAILCAAAEKVAGVGGGEK